LFELPGGIRAQRAGAGLFRALGEGRSTGTRFVRPGRARQTTPGVLYELRWSRHLPKTWIHASGASAFWRRCPTGGRALKAIIPGGVLLSAQVVSEPGPGRPCPSARTDRGPDFVCGTPARIPARVVVIGRPHLARCGFPIVGGSPGLFARVSCGPVHAVPQGSGRGVEKIWAPCHRDGLHVTGARNLGLLSRWLCGGFGCGQHRSQG